MFEQYKEKTVEEVVGLAEALSRQVNNHYYDLGELLFYIKENEVYKHIEDGAYSDDKAGWRRFCDDKLDVGYRTAQYWLNIYAYFFGMTIERNDLQGMGWSKAKELVDLTENLEVLKRFIKFAKEHSFADLVNEIAKYKASQAGTEEPLNVYETIRFKLPTYQLEEVQHALELAKEVFDVQDDNQALSNLALDWVQLKANIQEKDFESE